jgi:hypothetical protein
MSARNTEALIGKTNRARRKTLRCSAGPAHQTSKIPAAVAYPDTGNLKRMMSKKRRITAGAINFKGEVNGEIKQKELTSLPADAGFDDPAILIGLAIAFGKNSGLVAVPNVILVQLEAAARNGCGSTLNPIAARTFENAAKPNVCSTLGGHHG